MSAKLTTEQMIEILREPLVLTLHTSTQPWGGVRIDTGRYAQVNKIMGRSSSLNGDSFLPEWDFDNETEYA